MKTTSKTTVRRLAIIAPLLLAAGVFIFTKSPASPEGIAPPGSEVKAETPQPASPLAKPASRIAVAQNAPEAVAQPRSVPAVATPSPQPRHFPDITVIHAPDPVGTPERTPLVWQPVKTKSGKTLKGATLDRTWAVPVMAPAATTQK